MDLAPELRSNASPVAKGEQCSARVLLWPVIHRSLISVRRVSNPPERFKEGTSGLGNPLHGLLLSTTTDERLTKSHANSVGAISS